MTMTRYTFATNDHGTIRVNAKRFNDAVQILGEEMYGKDVQIIEILVKPDHRFGSHMLDMATKMPGKNSKVKLDAICFGKSVWDNGKLIEAS